MSQTRTVPQFERCEVVPAHPGYSVVSYIFGEGDKVTDFHLEPVLAWAITVGSATRSPLVGKEPITANVMPITVEGIEEDYKAIKYPNGEFCFPHVMTAATFERALQFARGELDE